MQMVSWPPPLSFTKLFRLLPPIPMWPAWAYCPAHHSALSLPSFPTSSRHHLLFLKKKSRSRPNRVASLGILSGSLPGSSCLSVPVGASLYSFVEPLQFSPLFLFPYPITNSQLPPLNFLALTVSVPFPPSISLPFILEANATDPQRCMTVGRWGKSIWKPLFSGSMFNFGGVNQTRYSTK